MYMESEKSFLTDDCRTGFSVLISGGGKGGKTSIRIQSRANPGEPLKEILIDDASDAQLDAVCEILDNP